MFGNISNVTAVYINTKTLSCISPPGTADLKVQVEILVNGNAVPNMGAIFQYIGTCDTCYSGQCVLGKCVCYADSSNTYTGDDCDVLLRRPYFTGSGSYQGLENMYIFINECVLIFQVILLLFLQMLCIILELNLDLLLHKNFKIKSNLIHNLVKISKKLHLFVGIFTWYDPPASADAYTFQLVGSTAYGYSSFVNVPVYIDAAYLVTLHTNASAVQAGFPVLLSGQTIDFDVKIVSTLKLIEIGSTTCEPRRCS